MLRPRPNVLLVLSLAIAGCRAPESGADAATDLGEVLRLVDANYVRATSRPELVAVARDAMLAALDPYCGYLDAAQYAQLQSSLAGALGGVGMRIEIDVTGQYRVRAPFRDSPALAAGLRAGDVIESIDGRAPAGLDIDAVLASLRGPAGSTVQLAVRRGAQPIAVRVTRATIQLPSVRWHHGRPDGGSGPSVDDTGFAYLRIKFFTKTTADEVARALASIAAGGARGIVVDLRQNPGGLLSAAIGVADHFLEQGRIVTLRRRVGADETIDATPGSATRLPLAVLIDGASLSAAEVLAACLQDNGRALVVGSRSYGKGTVQKILPLAGGGAMKLTVEHHVRPSGAWIERHLPGVDPERGGVAPDAGMAVDVPDAAAEALAAELQARDDDDGCVGLPPLPAGTDIALARARAALAAIVQR